MAKDHSADGEDRYGVVGHPVDHSRSPTIHRLFARQTNESIKYELIDAAPGELETAVLGFAAAGGRGLNVTVPHKSAVMELCQDLGDAASQAGAVNTLTFLDDGRIKGDNTDGAGLVRDLVINREMELAGKRVLVLGAGGAARGIIGPLLDLEPEELRIANRTEDRARELASGWQGVLVCSFDDLRGAVPYDLIINATSAGLKGEQPPFPSSILGRNTLAYDLVYSLKETPFEGWARENGVGKAAQGWGMLVEQAAESFEIWRGVRPNTQAILTTLLGANADR